MLQAKILKVRGNVDVFPYILLITKMIIVDFLREKVLHFACEVHNEPFWNEI